MRTVSRWQRESRSGATRGGRDGVVSYKLARQRTITAYEQGQKLPQEVCDAQPELRRVAHHHAVDLQEDCPICEGEGLAFVTFAFGQGLPPAGRCLTSEAELEKLRFRGKATTCYRVEVCRQCWWNHLRESFVLSRPEVTSPAQ